MNKASALWPSARSLRSVALWAKLWGVLLCLCAGGIATPAATAEAVQFDGFVEPLEDIQVAALEMGNLQELCVRLGDRVEAGDVIAVLDNSLQSSAVDIARLQAEMRGPLEAAAAERDLNAARVEKLRRLQVDGLVRPDELRRAEADLKIAEARLMTVEEERQLRIAELQRYELQLSRRRILAPISGTVAQLYRKAGEFVSPSDPAVVRLITTEQLVAVVNVPAEYAPSISPQMRVRVQMAMHPGSLEAAVQSVAPAIEGESGTVQIRVLLANPDGQLRAGDRCTVTFVVPLLHSARNLTAGSGR